MDDTRGADPSAPRDGQPAVRALGGGVLGLLFNVRVLRLLGQVAAVGVLVGFALYLRDNYLANLRDRGLSLTWSFLDEPTGFNIPHVDFSFGQPVRDALYIGVRNTLNSAVVGVILATILGLVVGVLRLSTSWVARKAATLYVETLRNVPVLLIILFTAAALRTLPRVQDAFELPGVMVVSNRQVSLVSPRAEHHLLSYVALLACAAVAAWLIWSWRTHVSDRTGEPHHRFVWASSFFVAVAIGGYILLDAPITLSHPEQGDARATGGAELHIAYVAITFGLGLYHGSHIAEIVRGSIQAVPHGQTEAATAIGLSSFARLRYVILPQALRIAVPPTINQYLSLTKNTSLGIAVAYSDLFAISFQLVGGSRAPTLQLFIILMGLYLTLSLTISLLMNIFNRRIQLVER